MLKVYCYLVCMLSLFTFISVVVAQEGEPKDQPPAEESATIPWEASYDAALKKAREANKPLLLYVYLYGQKNKYCEAMDANILAAPEVAKFIAENFVCYKEEKKEGKGIMLKFSRAKIPHIIILRAEDENKLGDIPGYPDSWQAFLQQVKAIYDSIAIEKEAREKLEKNPDDVEANFKLAGVWMIRGYADQGIQLYEKVIKLDPKNEKGFMVSAGIEVGKIYLDGAQVEEARRVFKKILEVDSNNSKGGKEFAEYGEARILVQFEDKFDEAITAFEKFVKSYPESKLLPESYLLLGYAYYAKKRYDEAIGSWETLVKRFPESEFVDKANGFIATAKNERDSKRGK